MKLSSFCANRKFTVGSRNSTRQGFPQYSKLTIRLNGSTEQKTDSIET